MCGLACRGGGDIRLENIQAGKGVGIVRSFVSDCNAVETGCQITCLGSLADLGEPFKERCIVTSLQRLFGGWNQKSFLALLRSWEERNIADVDGISRIAVSCPSREKGGDFAVCARSENLAHAIQRVRCLQQIYIYCRFFR